jgi:hypothetical protein
VRLPYSESQQPGDILATFGWLVKVEHGADRGDACRVYLLVTLVVVPLGMNEIHRRRDTRDLIYVSCIGPQILVVDEAPDVALEVPVIHGIETHQRGEQPDIRLGQRVVAQESRLRQPLLQPIQRLEQWRDRFLIRGLRRGKPRLVDTVVDGRVDTLVPARAPMVSNALLNIRMISDDSLLTIVWVCWSHSTGTVARPE